MLTLVNTDTPPKEEDKPRPPWLTDPWNYSSWDGHKFEQSEMACGRCQFWESVIESYGNGLCRRHAPLSTAPFDETMCEAAITQALLTEGDATDAPLKETTEVPRVAWWPTTHNFDWCGEFKRRSTEPRGLTLPLLAFIVALLWIVPAQAGDIVNCAEKAGSGRWVYRIIDERKCWFPAGALRRGQEKPLEELRWRTQIESPPDIPAISIMSPEPDVFIPPKAPLSEFERRWRGAVEGWDHNE